MGSAATSLLFMGFIIGLLGVRNVPLHIRGTIHALVLPRTVPTNEN